MLILLILGLRVCCRTFFVTLNAVKRLNCIKDEILLRRSPSDIPLRLSTGKQALFRMTIQTCITRRNPEVNKGNIPNYNRFSPWDAFGKRFIKIGSKLE